MTRVNFDFTPADHSALNSAAKILASRYRGYASYDDIHSELVIWLAEHYDRAERWRSEFSDKHAERTLIRALRNAGEKYCRAEKAEWEGYSTEDEFFYSIPMVADLIQLYFDDEWMIPNGLELTRTSGGKPASEGGNLMSMVADVGRAYEALPPLDKELLEEVYGGKATVSDVIANKALDWRISNSAANSRIRRVVGRLRANLGGPSPYGGGITMESYE